jgi:hypothetical protein
MTLEGGLGVLAGVEANSISVLTWAETSAVEGLPSAIGDLAIHGQAHALRALRTPGPALGRRQLVRPCHEERGSQRK